jgi:hypothetical protein
MIRSETGREDGARGAAALLTRLAEAATRCGTYIVNPVPSTYVILVITLQHVIYADELMCWCILYRAHQTKLEVSNGLYLQMVGYT